MTLYKCAQTSPAACDATAVGGPDDSTYSYYAGPVRVNSPRNCVSATGAIEWAGKVRAAYSGTVGC